MRKRTTGTFYILVNAEIVVAHSNSEPRVFAKRKKAQNFIEGRRLLKNQKTRIVTNISKNPNRLKVDY